MTQYDEKTTRCLLMKLWSHWTVTMAVFIVVLLLPLFFPHLWLPVPVALLAYTLRIYSRNISYGQHPSCVLILRVGMLTLFWTAAVMGTINILNSTTVLDGIIDMSGANREIPFITCLIFMPVLILVSLWELLFSGRTRFCRDCRMRTGYIPANSVVGRIYENEARYQLQLILSVSSLLSVVQWWYYLVYYINVNLNSPDRFFFNFMPALVLAFLVFFLLMRCGNIIRVIGPLTSAAGPGVSVVRYLVLAGDCLLLAPTASGRWDTPVSSEVNPVEFISPDDAAAEFDRLSDISDARMRFLYANKSHDNVSEIIHYAAFLPGEAGETPMGRLHGEWMTLDRVDRLMRSASLTAELSSEIYRIYTIAMAWKVYTPEGRRRYPIKHYRPTFRLRDLPEWDVDFNDLRWFDVAVRNEDRPFYRTRRLWNRLKRHSAK